MKRPRPFSVMAVLVVLSLFVSSLHQAAVIEGGGSDQTIIQDADQSGIFPNEKAAGRLPGLLWMDARHLERQIRIFRVEEYEEASALSKELSEALILLSQEQGDIQKQTAKAGRYGALPEDGKNDESSPSTFYKEDRALESVCALLLHQQESLSTRFSDENAGLHANDGGRLSGFLEEDRISKTEDLNRAFDSSPHGAAGQKSENESLFVKACPAYLLDAAGFEGSSEALMLPASGTVSAGTWAYPGGGMHLGLDLALGMYTPLQAPADGIILYASSPVPSNCGYLGNMCGWPYGGGNTICMLCKAGGQIFAVSLCHLSNQIYVSAGMKVRQGDVLAASGNSGNSTGPHTHIEVFEIYTDMQGAADYFISSGADFSFGCGWSAPATCSSVACRIRPESVF